MHTAQRATLFNLALRSRVLGTSEPSILAKTRRPPNPDGFQKLLATTRLEAVDVTYFDTTSMEMLKARIPNPQRPAIIIFNGSLSDEGVITVNQLTKSIYIAVQLENLKTNQLLTLSKLNKSAFIHRISINNCELDPESAVVLANLGYHVVVEDNSQAKILLFAAAKARLYYFTWNGRMTKEQAEVIAANPLINYIQGDIVPDEGTIQVLATSTSLQALRFAGKPITTSDIHSFQMMPALIRVDTENCIADFESIQQLASKPGMKTIGFVNGPLSIAELQILQENARLGGASVLQSNFAPVRSSNAE